MNRMHSSSTFCRPSKLFITTEVESRHSLPEKQFVNNRESNSWIVRNVLLRGENLLDHSQSDEPSTCAPAHRESEPIRGDSSLASGAILGLGGKSMPTDCRAIRPTNPPGNARASESTLIETVRLSNVGFNPAKELEGIDVWRLRSNQEPAANGIGESLAQDILGLRFSGP